MAKANFGVTMPLFMVKKGSFDSYRFGKKDVELRTIKPPWKNSKVGDMALIQCGKKSLFKKITKIHKGSLARIFLDVNYKRVFPEATTILEAVKATKEIYQDSKEFVAFQLVDFS